MKKVFGFLLLMTLLGSCAVQAVGPALLDGQMLGIREGTALNVMAAAIRADSDAFIFQKPGTLQFAFFKALPGGWGSVFVDAADPRAMTAVRNATITGTYMNGKTGAELIHTLENQYGWARVGAGYLTFALRTAVKIGGYVRYATGVTPLIMFVGPLTQDNMPFALETSNE